MSRDYFGGKVEKGVVVMDEPLRWRAVCARHEGRRVQITLKREEQKRSLQANKFYWSCIVPMFSDWSGYDKEESHAVLTGLFLKVERVLPTGEVVDIGGRTSTLTTQEFAAYTERVCRFLAEQGMYVPQPGEIVRAAL